MALRTPTLQRPHPTGRSVSELEDTLSRQHPVFEVLFDELLHARSRYEDLRINGESASERADLLHRMHALRASLAYARPETL